MSGRTSTTVPYARTCRALCSTLGRTAAETWTHLHDSERLNVSVSEESITDFNLLNIERAHPGVLDVTQFTKKRESETGADWEWWLGDGRTHRYCRLWIQVKKLTRKAQRFAAMNDSVGKGPNKQLQFDLLYSQARQNSAIPLYCFYNYWDEVDPFAGCTCLACQQHTASLVHHGCTIASAHSLRYFPRRARSQLQCIKSVAVPWHRLVCLCRPMPSTVDFVDRVAALLSSTLHLADGDIPIWTKPPGYVRGILSGQMDVHDLREDEYAPIVIQRGGELVFSEPNPDMLRRPGDVRYVLVTPIVAE